MKKKIVMKKTKLNDNKETINEFKSNSVDYINSIQNLSNSDLTAFIKEVRAEMNELKPMCLPGKPPIPEFSRLLNIYKKLTEEFNKRLNNLNDLNIF